MLRALTSIALLTAVAAPAMAQQTPNAQPTIAGSNAARTAKPTLASADYAKWETLNSNAISADGKWLAYDLRRGNGSTELRYRAVSGSEEHTARSATTPQFTSDSHWLLFTVTPDTAGGGGRGGRGSRGSGNGGGAGGAPVANHNKVEVVDLRSGASTEFDDVQAYSLSSDGARVAFRRYATPGQHAADVIVRDLAAGTELAFGNVADLAWSPDGSLLAMAIDVGGKTGDGVQVLDTKSGTLRSLDAGDAEYSGLAWREGSDDLAALRSRADSAFADTSFVVLAWRHAGSAPAKTEYDFSNDASFPKELRVADYRAPQWSDDGSTLFFGVAPREPKVAPERRAPGELPPARVEVWHWKDVREFHQQQVSAAQDRQRTMLVAWHVGAPTVARLAEDPMETVQLSENGAVALASTDAPYAREYMSGRDVRDVYRVDVSTGKRDKLLTRSHYGATLSPSGRYALYEQDGQWWSADLTTGARANLTGKIKSVFVNMEDDHPVPERRAYGAAGFTTGEKSVILYDRFDLWQVSLDGSNPTRITRGREDSTVYRCASEFGGGRGGRGGRGGGGAERTRSTPCQLDNESGMIDPAKTLTMTATGEYSKKSGYATVTIGQPVERLVWADKMVSGLRKAAGADVYVVEQQTYEDPPNLYVAGARLAGLKQVSNIDAFQSDYAWGKQVLMNYTNKRGDKLQMMLTYPANYEPGKKYPMVVYYYEGLSQGFHQYVTPNARNPYNTTVFAQNGYFVLRPDIVFQYRNPGYSGLDCVTSAVRTAEARVADIDAKHVGNFGHSWGGYQSAFYAVHNPGIFAASIAGAPLTDLISMYGYTSGNSGLPETGHYETSQERMQVPLWEDPQAYIRNSTVYAVDSLHTPLLLEEGDADGNVNHFQSEELYNFGRRLGKNVVYLVYEGENHNVARPESQADYLNRQLEWFGYYLKGDTPAKWITDGETYAERQRILNASAAGGVGGGPAVQAGNAAGRGRRP